MQRTADRVAEIRADMDALGLSDDYSMADVALKFALSRPEVSTVIAGMRTVKQVEQNTRTSQLRDLPDEAITRLRRHNWRRGIWYGGK